MGEGSRTKLFLKEPLLHFAAAGALLFLARSFWVTSDEGRIVVTPEIENGLAVAREEILLRPLSPQEREKLVSDYIDEEVLLREAYREGLDRGDPRIRRWLVEKVEFLLAEEPEEPTPEELDALLLEHPEKYMTPRSVTFDHVFFAGEPDPILSRLRSGADFHGLGDEFWLGQSLNRFSELELTTTFGAEFTSRLQVLPVGQWEGPLASSRGAHLVHVRERHEPEPLSREEAQWALREDWLRAKREESRARKLGELRARYRIVR